MAQDILTYDLFISYRRKDDLAFANWLRRQLVTYQLPGTFRERSARRLQVYQDTAYERASEDFWTNSVLPALQASRHLAIVVTPGVLEPRTDPEPSWVEREIAAFTATEQGRNVFVLRSGGSTSDMLPFGLMQSFPRIEQIDIRDARTAWQRIWKRHSLRNAMLTVAATLYGVLPEEMPILRQEEERRKRRTASAVAAISLLLLAAMSALALGWLFQRNEARSQRDIATARQLAAQSSLIIADDPTRIEESVLLAVESLRRVHLFENDAAMRRGLKLLLKPIGGLPGPPADTLAFDPRSRFIAVAGVDHIVRIAEVPGGRELMRLPHPSSVLTLAFSPDGRYLASGCGDSNLRVFDAATGRLLAQRNNAGRVLALNFSPDGRHLAIGGDDKPAQVVETAEWTQVLRLGHDAPVTTLAYSSDGRYLSTRSGGRERIFDTVTGKNVSNAAGTTDFDAVTLGPSGRYFAEHRLYDAKTGRTLAMLPSITHAAALSPDGRSIAACGGLASRNKSCGLFRPSEPPEEVVRLPPHRNLVVAITYSPDSRYVATTGEDGAIRVFAAADGTEAGVIPSRGVEKTPAIVFSPDGRYAAVRVGAEALRIYALSSDVVLDLYKSGAPRNVSFSADGRLVAHAGRAEVFELTGKRMLPDRDLEPALAVALSPDGSYLALGSVNTLRVVKVTSGEQIIRQDDTGRVQALAFSADGRHLAIGYQSAARVIELPGGKELRAFKGFTELRAVALSPDARYLGIGVRGAGHVFELQTGDEVFQAPHEGFIVHAVAFSQDARYFASGSLDKIVPVYEISGRHVVSRLIHAETVLAIDFSADSHFIATGGIDRTARVFELSSSRETARFVHENTVLAVVFSEDGRYLTAATGVVDANERRAAVAVSRYPLRRDDLIREACARVTRDLMPDEWTRYLGKQPHQGCHGLLSADAR